VSDCDRIRDDLSRREVGLLDPAATQDLERHLVGCDACRTYSRRMRTLVSVLEQYPEIRALPRPSALQRLSRGRVAVVAAAVLMALAVPLVGPLLGRRIVLEGGFDLPSRGVLVARDSGSSLVAHDHRLRFRKGTRVRLVGVDEVYLEEGRLDVSGLREEASGLKIGTPLGRVVVVGTRFVVEVTPVNKSHAAVAAGSFVVGVMVSSGVVTYADYHRLEAGQGIVDETGKGTRRVVAADLERRLRSAADRERDLEIRLAALGVEKERLRGDLAALERGEMPVLKAPLSPEDRRSRTRHLAQVLVKSFYQARHSTDEGSLVLDEKELKRLSEGETVKVEHEVHTRVEADGKAIAEVLELANDLGMNFFDSASFCSKPEMVEELIMAVLEARAATASGYRSAVEGAVRSAYGALPGSWDSRMDERVAQARAVQGALAQLEGSLSADQMKDLYETARTILTAPDFVILAHADAKVRGEWVDRVAKAMELDPADRPVLDAGVDELVGQLGKIHGDLGSSAKNGFEYMIRCREAGAELLHQLSARFPDRKDKIVNALDPQ
jgi:hypothetical protein